MVQLCSAVEPFAGFLVCKDKAFWFLEEMEMVLKRELCDGVGENAHGHVQVRKENVLVLEYVI